MPAERVLVDTNVFVYATDSASPHSPAASTFLDAVAAGRFHGCVTLQVLLEFVSVVTNPKRVATVRTPEEAWAVADKIAASFTVLAPPDDLYARTSALAQSLKLARGHVFDLAIALTALNANVTTVWTFDVSVFTRVPGMTAHTPGAPAEASASEKST
jgi:predicted nucleic acid-binding protein